MLMTSSYVLQQRATTLLSEDAKKADDEMFEVARFPMQKEHSAKFSDKKVIPLDQVDRFTMMSRIY